MISFARKLVGEKKPLVCPTILAASEVATRYTPDLWNLRQFIGQFVFVADEMMSDHRFHHLLPKTDAMRVATAYSKRKMVMLNKQLGKASWPALLAPSRQTAGPIGRAQPGIIKGEVYFVRSTHIPVLDKYKENGTVHTRERMALDIPYRETVNRTHMISTLVENRTVQKTEVETILGEWKHFDGHAWMYVGIPEYFFWSNYADQFTPAKLKIPQDKLLRPYYFFE